MPSRDPAAPTARQAEYLAFIRAFTDRWGIPPSFEDIGRHFMTTTPAVNGMIKTLEARGFLTRIPGQARTLRVIVPAEPSVAAKPARGEDAQRESDKKVAVQVACLVIERLIPALQDATDEQLRRAFDAVDAAVNVSLLGAGASEKEQKEARTALVRVAMIAQGRSPELRPGRKLPWWRRPR